MNLLQVLSINLANNKTDLIRILQYTAEIYYEESIGKIIWQAAKMSLCDDYV